MRYIRQTENPNTLVGILLLILLAVFAGPTVLPELLSTNVQFVDEGVQCGRLRLGEDRASHQSLIGRAVANRNDAPLSLSVKTGSVPTTPEGIFSISISITNETIGTIPILITPDFMITNVGQALNGIGVVFNSAAVPASTEAVTSYPATRIRLLGPRQTCVHRVNFTPTQIPNFSALTAANSTITAFYRNNSPGTAVAQPGETAIFNDQGLWTGIVQSNPVTVGGG